MAKGNRKRKAKAVDPARVLSGAVRLGLRELFDLIHDVNPTERGLSREKEEQRYALKSRLQSLLVRDFDAELDVRIDDDHRVVAIHHRYGGGDGCHAILDELDEDVRAMLRRRFDERMHTGADGSEAAPAPRPADPGEPPPEDPTSVDALLRAAEAHLEDYAYDEAQAALEAAFAASGGATSAARPLLRLLVDLLGTNATALALRPRLARDASEDGEVRGLLALAAARAGEAAAAKDWLRDVADETRRVEVHAALADRALAAHELAEAASALSAIQAIDPASPHVLRIEGAIAREQQEERAPLEAQLAELDDEPVEARRLAETILARWPDSRVARLCLKALDDRERAERLTRALEAVDQAERAGKLDEALDQLRGARALCSDEAARAALDGRAASLAERIGRQAEAAQVTAVVAALTDSQDAEAPLTSYLGLDRHLRQVVAERLQKADIADVLPWLDAIDPSPGRRTREAITAVLALLDARSAVSRGDASTASDRLGPHLSTLKRVSEAKRVAKRATAELERERRAASEDALSAARSALERGDLDEAGRMLARVDRAVASEEDVEPLAQALELARRKGTLLAQYAAMRNEGDLVTARKVAGEIVDLDPTDASWTSRRDELLDAIRDAWQIQTVVIEGDDETLSPWGRQLMLHEVTPAVRLTSSGSLVHATVNGPWLSVWLYTPGGKLARVLGMRLPEPFDAVLCTTVEGDQVWILGSAGRLLGLSLTDGVPTVWESYADFIDEGFMLEGGAVTLDGQARYLWLHVEKDREPQIIVVDRHHHRERARDTSGYLPCVLPGASTDHGGVHVLHNGSGIGVHLLDRRGQRARGLRAPSRLATHSAAVRPVEGAVYLLGSDEERGDEGEAVPFEVVAIDADGARSAPFLVEGSDNELLHCLAGSRARDRAFVYWYVRGEGPKLTALRAGDDGKLEQLYRVDLPRGGWLVQDAEARITALAYFDGELDLHQLSDLPPQLDRHAEEDGYDWPRFSGQICGKINQEDASTIRMRHALLFADAPLSLDEALARHLREHADDPTALTEMMLALDLRNEQERASAAMQECLERHPDAVPLRALAVVHAAIAGRWAEVAAAAGELDALTTYRPLARHLHHVVGVAQFRGGDVATARRIWEQGAAQPGDCELDDYVAFVTALQGDAVEDGGPAPAAARVAAAIRRADADLEQGDPRSALRALAAPAIFQYGEMQSLARVVAAHLALDGQTARDRFAKRLALSAFVDAQLGPLRRYRLELPLPGHTWDEERLRALADEAQAWLER